MSGVGSVFVHRRILFAIKSDANSVQTQEKSHVNYFNPNAIGKMPKQNGKLSISLCLNPLTRFILFYFTYVLSLGKNSTHQHFCVMKLKENWITRAQLFEGRLALNPGLKLTQVSFSCVQKHFVGKFSLLFLELPIINL